MSVRENQADYRCTIIPYNSATNYKTHQDGSVHFHAAVKLTCQMRFNVVTRALHGLRVAVSRASSAKLGRSAGTGACASRVAGATSAGRTTSGR